MFFLSTYGLTENRWRLAAKAACTTMTSSFGGGITALVVSYIMFKGKTDVLTFINGTLGSLVAITGE
jgi:ammonia channel protein AmtB